MGQGEQSRVVPRVHDRVFFFGEVVALIESDFHVTTSNASWKSSEEYCWCESLSSVSHT